MRSKSMTIRLALLGAAVALLSTACSGAESSGIDEAQFQQALDTAVAGTVTAQALDLQRTKGAEAALQPTGTPSPTNSPIPDTATPDPSLTPTQQTSAEVTPEGDAPIFNISGPSVKVTVNTNCRSGPGKVYTWLGSLLIGEEAVIAGKDPSGAYWYITNPNQEGEFCWIWGAYAITSGNTAPLPVFTPGPTPIPQPDFSVGFREVESCAGAWQVEFEIVNTGDRTLQSVSTSVEDTVSGAKSGASAENAFIRKTGCADDMVKGKREPGETGFTVSLDLSNNPTGHLTFAKVTVCTEDDLYGDCTTREFYFTP